MEKANQVSRGGTIEEARLQAEARRVPGQDWKRWGPYLAERQWGTVREDYSQASRPWDDFPHDAAVWRAYRWGEDGLLGLCDRKGRLCFSLALWNGQDEILKERLFGLSGPEGNHGEDVKECYFYLDSSPTHSYLRGLYKYPQAAFPYQQLREENARRSREELEYELIDTGIFDEKKYFDVFVEYAKAEPLDILIRITVANRGPDDAPLHLLPTLWFRNTWSWGETDEAASGKPKIWLADETSVLSEHATLGRMRLSIDPARGEHFRRWMFTENETNAAKMWNHRNQNPGCKDAFHLAVVQGLTGALHTRSSGTKVAAYYVQTVKAHSEVTFQLRLRSEEMPVESAGLFGEGFDRIFKERQQDCDDFYQALIPPTMSPDESRVFRQACAGLLWSKQFYNYVVKQWLEEGPDRWPVEGLGQRNAEWPHLFNRDIISMPDKWEYPWYAAWDSAFHMIPFARLDAQFAREQLVLFLREWYMHPNGQIPAYEWNFSDVNPPVHAWACWRVYQMTRKQRESLPALSPEERTSLRTVHPEDREFLSRVFQKLLLNFTWWVNRKDPRGKQVFSGGFLGLDNIGVFDRSKPLPTGGHLEQADGTAWMAYYCSSMLSIAFELADGNPAYEDIASKFFEHYVMIAEAINSLDGTGLWDETDGFYYDHLIVNGKGIPLKIRSIVGLVPLLTVDVLDERVIAQLPGFRRRMDWLLKYRKDLGSFMTYMERGDQETGAGGLRLLAIPTRKRLERVLRYLLDEEEFLSPFGIRSLSKYHEKNPFVFGTNGERLSVKYVPGESDSAMFGGNSNWRGPIWFPINYLLIEAFERYHQFYGEGLRVECPTGSGVFMNMKEVADDLRKRLVKLFLSDDHGGRPCYARGERFINDPDWKDLILFYEYFHGDTGRGLGASHQTGWTALVASILQQLNQVRGEG